MTAAQRRGRKFHEVYVYDYDRAEWLRRATGTRDRVTAKRMEAMLRELGPQGKRRRDLTDPIVARRMTVGELFDYYPDRLDVLLARLSDIDIEPMVATFTTWLKGKVADDTAQHYAHHVRTLLEEGKPFRRSRLTTAALSEWLADIGEQYQSGTVRKYAAAMSRFAGFLKERDVLKTNPMRDVELPPAGKPRDRYLDPADAIRLAEAQPSPYREFSAILAGTGCDVSSALPPNMRKADVNVEHREIFVRGTKNQHRERWVRVADWAWPYVERVLEGCLTDDTPLMQGIPDRWVARDYHEAAIAKLVAEGHTQFAGYWMRDARHTFGVRLAKAGASLQTIADQLGHANTVMASKIYTKYQPSRGDRAEAEGKAIARDGARDGNTRTA